MSISPPSDIILDVARAADPTRTAEAASRLRRIGATAPDGAGFDAALAAFQPEDLGFGPAGGTDANAAARAFAAAPPESALRKPDAFGAFEAMVLTQFVDAMMPKDSAAVFGSGTGGQIWASMMAEQIAAKVADSGGIGIADRLRGADMMRTMPAGAPDAALRDTGDAFAGTMGALSQRGFLATLAAGDAAGSLAAEVRS